MVARSLLTSAALAVSLLSGAAGCASYVPFTQEIRDGHALASDDLKNLQFYNSDEIVLHREVSRDGRRVTAGHKLLVIAGKQVEEVVIEPRTPGVIIASTPTTLRVSFEEGTWLEFAVRGGLPDPQPVRIERGGFAEPPNPFPGNDRNEPYAREPLPSNGTGNYWLMANGGSTVDFDGQTWTALGGSSRAHLVISTESLEEVDEQRTVLRGRHL
ncbi:MAG: DNA-directed RNA polymerase [Polyangiaceae bacterium]